MYPEKEGIKEALELKFTEVHSELDDLDPPKSAGPHNVHPKMLTFDAPVFAAHLAILFNLLLVSSVFPTSLKKDLLRPYYKSGNRCSISNNVHIVMQSAVAKVKVCEIIVLDQLYFNLGKYVLTNYMDLFVATVQTS